MPPAPVPPANDDVVVAPPPPPPPFVPTTVCDAPLTPIVVAPPAPPAEPVIVRSLFDPPEPRDALPAVVDPPPPSYPKPPASVTSAPFSVTDNVVFVPREPLAPVDESVVFDTAPAPPAPIPIDTVPVIIEQSISPISVLAPPPPPPPPRLPVLGCFPPAPPPPPPPTTMYRISLAPVGTATVYDPLEPLAADGL